MSSSRAKKLLLGALLPTAVTAVLWVQVFWFPKPWGWLPATALTALVAGFVVMDIAPTSARVMRLWSGRVLVGALAVLGLFASNSELVRNGLVASAVLGALTYGAEVRVRRLDDEARWLERGKELDRLGAELDRDETDLEMFEKLATMVSSGVRGTLEARQDLLELGRQLHRQSEFHLWALDRDPTVETRRRLAARRVAGRRRR